MTEEHLRRIVQAREGELLALDEVEGVGIGEQHGSPAIKVYVRHLASPSVRRIPKRLDDVPVVVEESGTFEAY